MPCSRFSTLTETFQLIGNEMTHRRANQKQQHRKSETFSHFVLSTSIAHHRSLTPVTQSEECSQSRIWSGKKHYWIYFWVLKETFDKKHFHERFCIKALKIWSVIFFWIRPSNIKCGMLQSTRRSSWKFQQWWWWTTLQHAYFSNVEWVWSNLELVDFHNLPSIRKV